MGSIEAPLGAPLHGKGSLAVKQCRQQMEADGPQLEKHESKTRWVVVLTFATMVLELVVGYRTHSLALTADGWHMATHAGALGMAAFAYWFARTRATQSTFSFGTGKVHALAGYTSAVALAIVAIIMMYESVSRLVTPMTIDFGEALKIAVFGLIVNLASLKLLHPGGDHDHGGHDHDHGHDHGDHEHDDHDHAHVEHPKVETGAKKSAHAHGDHNIRAAYMHVFADAFTSILAIAALVCGRYYGWTMLDPLMGAVGGIVILRWSVQLCREAAGQLLDMNPSEELARKIRDELESLGDTRIVDFHLWEVGPKRRNCIVSLVTTESRSAEDYGKIISAMADDVRHVTVEVHREPLDASA
jgi:cation diffusion facilitator family transporter